MWRDTSSWRDRSPRRRDTQLRFMNYKIDKVFEIVTERNKEALHELSTTFPARNVVFCPTRPGEADCECLFRSVVEMVMGIFPILDTFWMQVKLTKIETDAHHYKSHGQGLEIDSKFSLPEYQCQTTGEWFGYRKNSLDIQSNEAADRHSICRERLVGNAFKFQARVQLTDNFGKSQTRRVEGFVDFASGVWNVLHEAHKNARSVVATSTSKEHAPMDGDTSTDS